MLPSHSFQDRILSYRQEFLVQKGTPSNRFAALRHIFSNYVHDVEDLSIMEYGTALIGAERIYDGLKAGCKAEHQQLKQFQKNLDERTLAIEQKLYLGLPDDLNEMEKVINEQESILEDQQKINHREEELLEKMRRIDIEHGKKLAAVEQTSAEKAAPLRDAHDSFRSKINQEENSVGKKTRILGLLPVIIIPIVLDLLAGLIGIQKPGENHFIFSHYFFLVSFLILEIFFSSKIKSNIAEKLSATSCLALLTELENAWSENQDRIQTLEKEYGITLQEVIATLDIPAEEANPE